MMRTRALFLLAVLLAAPAAARQKADPKQDPKGEAKPDKPDEPSAKEPKNGEARPEGAEAPAGEGTATPPPKGAPSDLEALRKEYHAIRESLFTSRARAAAVGDAVYTAKIQVHLRFVSGRFHTIRRATIRLDGANVYDDTSGAVASDEAPRFEGFVAPGTHLVTIRLEAQAKDDDRFVTTTEDTLTVDAVAGRLLLVKGRADDGGDMAFAWKKKQRGSYKLRLDVSVEAKERAK